MAEFVSIVGKDKHGKSIALYICVCENEFTARISDVRSGNTRSCGCLRKGAHKTHGMSGTRTYWSWWDMKRRCSSHTCWAYRWYGARGITYDPKWETFEGFLEDMGESPGKGWSLDKIDNDGNYCKENCQWLTRSDNSIKRNRKDK